MGPWGAMIMSCWGGFFCFLAAQWLPHVKVLILTVGISIAVLLAGIAYWQTKRLPPRKLSDRARKIVIWSTIGEGLGIFIGINAAINLGHPDLVLPVIALVVALHFLPMAHWIPFQRFYALAAGLCSVALVSALSAPPTGPVLAGLGGAMCLWIASLTTLAANRRAERCAATSA